MKLKLITILSFGFFACNNSTDIKLIDKEQNQKEVPINEYNCDFDKFVKDPRTPKLAKDIYHDNEWNLNKDDEALALLDSLTAEDKSLRPFYFKVVTKSQKKSDGYFSEGLGNVGYNYILNNTQEFASYFDNKQCHTEIDLVTWVDIVMLEFGIIGEGQYHKPIVDDYINTLKLNCNNCSTTQKETINKFGFSLKAQWQELLKLLNK